METTETSKYSLIIAEINEIDAIEASFREKYIQLKKVLERRCKEITEEETLQFPSLFSRLVFIGQKYNLSKSLEWQLQNIRVKATSFVKEENISVTQEEYNAAKTSIIDLFTIIYFDGVGERKAENISFVSNSKKYYDKIRVQVIAIDKENFVITCRSELLPYDLIVRYNVPSVNDIFNATVNRLWIGAQLNLIESYKEEGTGYFVPKYIVLEPDYLIDASALAECFQNYGKSYLHYFRRKFEFPSNSRHILMGNLANFFLDELVYAENPAEVEFNDVFIKAFRQSPFEFTSCEEIKAVSDFKQFMVKARTQFDNIKRVILYDFPKNGIDLNRCTLEPSFYCEKFGFQGRLDLLQLSDEKDDKEKIIELKSGSLPYPKEDVSKIAINHETQTTIYRLIIQTVFGKEARDISPMILYSSADNPETNLRLAAPYQTLEKEIINVRNLIVSTEHILYTQGDKAVEYLFAKLFNLDNYGRVPQFFVDRLTDLEKVWNRLSVLERKYLCRFISFVSRDLYIQKVGGENYDSNAGLATLWNTEFREREESLDLISELEILEIEDNGRDMRIRFKRNDGNECVNFREGEICILYPRQESKDTLLTNQVLKGTLAKIDSKEITIRFRYKQKNKDYLSRYRYWVIEHDQLDHTYSGMFRSLFSFFTANKEKRDIILGLEEPVSSYIEAEENTTEFTPAKKKETVIKKAIAARDYFLIVGPPGTGKTSVYARQLLELLYKEEKTNILLIAYTNRAVDELCETINKVFDCEDGMCDNYIRIGTELSCHEPYRHRLLQHVSATVENRSQLRQIIDNTRIFVGTLASVTGKPELFGIKRFDIAIIDEASQILEPQIVGLLPHFKKFILIGDHKQLSTISLQHPNKAKTKDNYLNSIELSDCNESYFERIFRICRKNRWNHAYDTLVYQGRMHTEIADFPNTHFYGGKLLPISEWQNEPLVRIKNEESIYHKILSEKRMAFFPISPPSNQLLNDKINEQEADITVKLATAVVGIYKQNNLSFDERKTIGIITPYRNQIALIKHKLQATGVPELCNIVVDTVERFQGSQRDIIILSFCINRPYQLDFFCNLNREKTVDRKLNVALTRARQQLFIVGNDYILSQNIIYKKLLDNMYIYRGKQL